MQRLKLRHKTLYQALCLCLSAAIAVAAWWAVSTIPSVSTVIVSPARVWAALCKNLASGVLQLHIRDSLIRVILGFALGLICSIPVAFLLGWYENFRVIVEPWIQFLRTIPPIALIPIIIATFGIGTSAKVAIIFFAVFLTMVVTIYQGVKNVDVILGAHVFAPQGQCVILALDSTDMSGEIMVRADSGIKTMQDLAGKNVAISAGTTSELVLSMGLKLNGMQKTDVNMINMDASGKVTAFMSNQIDAISIESPYTDQIRKDMGEENVTTLCSSADFLPDAVFTNSWVTTQAFLEDNEDVVVRFLRAWLKGTQDRYDDMDGTVEKVAEFINTDYDTAHLVAEKTNWLSTSEMKDLMEDGTMLQWYDTVKDMFLDTGLLDAQYDVPAEQYVKLDYLRQAMEDVGV